MLLRPPFPRPAERRLSVSLKLDMVGSPELEQLGRKRAAREVVKEIVAGAREISVRLEEQDGDLHVVIESDRGNRTVPVGRNR